MTAAASPPEGCLHHPFEDRRHRLLSRRAGMVTAPAAGTIRPAILRRKDDELQATVSCHASRRNDALDRPFCLRKLRSAQKRADRTEEKCVRIDRWDIGREP